MPNPILIETPQNKWTLVAKKVKECCIKRVRTGFKYYMSYRMTGDTPPENPIGHNLPREGIEIFLIENKEPIEFKHFIDVYIYARNDDDGIDTPGMVKACIE